MAIGAHPDDIEFYMAGTLLLLKKADYEIHYLNVASGNCGSTQHNSAATRSIRKAEARTAAKILGAHFHGSLTDDLEIFYNLQLLCAVAAVIREVKPKDHANTCRLAVTAAFARGMPNFKSAPSRPAADYPVTVYHAMPHGLRDGLRRRILPGAFVNTSSVHKTKRQALAAHQSQQGWLQLSQGLNSLLLAMEDMSLEVGRMSKRFKHAEGWRRHLHFGFCAVESDPLSQTLGGNYLVNKAYERSLERG